MNKELERGLYRSEFEKDACGIGLIAHIKGESSHGLVKNALNMLENMEHRGGCGCEPETGDGAGIMLKIDHDFFSNVAEKLGFKLPERGAYAVATIFYPKEERKKKIIAKKFEKIASDLSLEIIGTRLVPTNNKYAGATAIANEPSTEHTNEQAIAGKTSRLIEIHESVTWRAKHFGIYQTLSSKITEFDRPNYFVDEMQKGAFKRFKHEHHFTTLNEQTLMTDIFDYTSPFGFLGKLVDKLFLEKYMTELLIKRNRILKEFAESDQWKKVLS